MCRRQQSADAIFSALASLARQPLAVIIPSPCGRAIPTATISVALIRYSLIARRCHYRAAQLVGGAPNTVSTTIFSITISTLLVVLETVVLLPAKLVWLLASTAAITQ